MVKPALLVYDSLDDRKEIYTLLARLPPQTRLAWLDGCCASVPTKGGVLKPRVKDETRRLAALARWDSSADDRLTLEVYSDTFYLAAQYSLDMDAALARLVALARRSG